MKSKKRKRNYQKEVVPMHFILMKPGEEGAGVVE